MIDRTSRDLAVGLLTSFLEGQIGFDELDVNWPISDDLALEAIGQELWNAFYSEFKSKFIGTGPSPSISEQELVNRAREFLRSDEEYQWSTDRNRGEEARRSNVNPNLWPFFSV